MEDKNIKYESVVNQILRENETLRLKELKRKTASSLSFHLHELLNQIEEFLQEHPYVCVFSASILGFLIEKIFSIYKR